ncbi:TetR/AcrR family transcriptional regulator [Cellulosimicrobium sp. CUA-896]|uniref:TetR/AcrR family transcriptional regulator n=1 Tax=Cellulosimicrobium sp. CUA-896 TaxID=1517881 RepID=UPI0009F904C7
MPAPRTARALARETLTREILDAARARLASTGPAELSLRAVARDVGMVSSAVYRYFPSRDALLTALLVECYDELGAAVEQAEAAVVRDDVEGRWLAACRALRTWCVGRPGDFALLYGTPVPGYAAPRDTVEPATRVVRALVRVVADAAARARDRSPRHRVRTTRPRSSRLRAPTSRPTG